MRFSDYLSRQKIEYNENFNTASLSSIKAGGRAKYLLLPRSVNEFISLVKLVKAFDIRYKVIGNCTNTAFSDDGFDGAIICTKGLKSYSVSVGEVNVDAGVSFPNLIKRLISGGLYIPPELSGIPGSIGGMLRNNAGAFGKCFADIFIRGSFLNADTAEVMTLSNSELNFGYRRSILLEKNIFLLSADLKISQINNDDALTEIASYALIRRERHPNEPSLGSFFKRTDTAPAAKLIDDLGFKGYRVGAASISDKHAGFIVNNGGATVSDIDAVAKAVEAGVYEKLGIALQREAELVL